MNPESKINSGFRSRKFIEFNSDCFSHYAILNGLKDFSPLMLLNSNNKFQHQADKYSSHELIIGAGIIDEFRNSANLFEALNDFIKKTNDWIFGCISYDVKNQVEKLSSLNSDRLFFPDNYFFRPRYVLKLKNDKLIIYYSEEFDDETSVNNLFDRIRNAEHLISDEDKISMQFRLDKQEYIETIKKIKSHIQRGDIYEVNFCAEFFAENVDIDPFNVYRKLNDFSPMPFSSFFHSDEFYLMSASPERFLAKRGNKIISQPIKGTIRRDKDPEADKKQIEKLKSDKKELSENVMIVDLVRNDLSRTAIKGSVNVEELFGIKTFEHLHHMVSTVTSEIKEGTIITDVMKNAFPMGSMTGAPKVKAMELIEKFESTKRGMYSGTAGYFSPDGDCDFNVVIRSLLYNSEKKYLSYMSGSAITNASIPEEEFNECMLKAESLKKIFL